MLRLMDLTFSSKAHKITMADTNSKNSIHLIGIYRSNNSGIVIEDYILSTSI